MNRPIREARYHYFKDGRNGDRDREIYELRMMGYKQKDIAAAYSLSPARVMQIEMSQKALMRWHMEYLSNIADSIQSISKRPVYVTP